MCPEIIDQIEKLCISIFAAYPNPNYILFQIFDRLRKEDPDSLDKLVAIPGDITALGLGMSEESEKLMENVSLVFHVAATVRFDEPISNAIMLNIRGTQEALKFAMRLKHLNVSTHGNVAKKA